MVGSAKVKDKASEWAKYVWGQGFAVLSNVMNSCLPAV